MLKKVTMKNPKKSRILIFNKGGSDTIIELILSGLDYSLLHTSFEILYFSPQILLRMVKNIEYFDLINTKKIGLNIYLSYLISCLEYINPKVVITYVDNDPSFYTVARRYPKATFYAIQNGIRNKSDLRDALLKPDNSINYLVLPNFFCWGPCDIDNYRNFGHTIINAYPVGSLRGSYYCDSIRKSRNTNDYDICYISQYSPEIFKYGYSPHYKDALIKIQNLLAAFIEKNHVRLCIACRSRDQEEFDYFNNLFGKRSDIILRNLDNPFSTYSLMDRSDITITMNSSAALEAFGWGKKVFFCNFAHEEIGDFYMGGICSIQRNDPIEFENKLKYLLSMDQDEFELSTETDRKYLISYNFQTPAHQYIREIIIRKIEN